MINLFSHRRGILFFRMIFTWFFSVDDKLIEMRLVLTPMKWISEAHFSAILPMPTAFLCWNSFFLKLIIGQYSCHVTMFLCKTCTIFHDFKIAFYEVSVCHHFRAVLLIVSQAACLVGIIQLTHAWKEAFCFFGFFVKVFFVGSACSFQACVALLCLLQSSNMHVAWKLRCKNRVKSLLVL